MSENVSPYLEKPPRSELEVKHERLEALAKELAKGLAEIEALQPERFKFPDDWSQQIKACAECLRYKSHPVQDGICDTHRRPLWDRQKHDAAEERRLGYQAKGIATLALSRARAAGLIEGL